jgi:DcuC family C4-dicarboxylate transporter
MDWQFGAALIVGTGALVAVWRGADVRLVLFSCGALLTALVGSPTRVLDAFLRVLGDGRIVGPICSAMGYAFVLRSLGADRAMVELLAAPLRRIRWALVPGGCIVGFLVNMAITSQTAAAAAVGPILVPLLESVGYTPVARGAVLVLGCSTGGNLFNPGEPDIVTIAVATGLPVHSAIEAVILPQIVAFIVATAVLTVMLRSERPREHTESGRSAQSHSILKAVLPPLPIILLFVLMPQWNIVPAVRDLYPDGVPVTHVMVPCAAFAIALNWRSASALTKSFFEGMGYGFANVISIIIAAACFLEGLAAVGAIERLVGLLHQAETLAPVVSMYVTLGLAVLSGSGTAPSVTFSKAVLPDLTTVIGVTRSAELGALGAIGASLGRTMSPLAAVVIFSANVAGAQPRAIVRRTAPALIAASIAALATYYLTSG